MTVAELMNGRSPDPMFEGFSIADDMVLAVGFGEAQTPGDYIVAQRGITGQSGSLKAQTQESQYLRNGQATTKTGTTRTFQLSGDRYNGDDFQDALLAHDLKFGTGQAVIRPYVYFNLLTGKGETGVVSIAVDNDLDGEAGENAAFGATLSSVETPKFMSWTEMSGGV